MTEEYAEKLRAVVQILENVEGLIRECRQEIQGELRQIMQENLRDIEG